MNHPIYKDKAYNESRSSFIRMVEISGYIEASMMMAHVVGKKLGVPALSIVSTMEAVMRSYIVEDAVAKNGHVLIDVENDDWSSSTSASTISKIDLGHFKFPFRAGTIKFKNKNVSYSYNKEKLMITHEENSGVFLIEVDAGREIGEEIEKIGNISDYNKSIIYEVLSILLYIATFNDREKVKAEVSPFNKGSNRKSIPKHKIHDILLRQSITGSKNKSSNISTKSEMSWIVRGHWRNQWYAKEGVNKPLWMNAYWKGSGKEQVEKVYKV